MESQPFSDERRRFRRLTYKEPISFRDLLSPHETFTGALAQDVSTGGLRMNSNRFLPKDGRVLLLLSLPGQESPMRVISRVAWTRSGPLGETHDTGLEFIGMDSRDRDAVAGYVERGVVRQSLYA